MPPTAAIVIPTRRRADYLQVALGSVAPQAAAAQVPILVVDDADVPDAATERVATEAGARYEPNPTPGRGINGARNHGTLRAGGAELLLFLDDDVRVGPGWLPAMLSAADDLPDTVGFLTGPVHARFEGHRLLSCGRERPPITTFEPGGEDRDVDVAWGVNLGVRRAVLDLVGPWDERLVNGGDEEELQRRWLAARPEGRIRSVAAAWVEHRRAGDDARLRSLAAATRARGQAARRYDVARGVQPSLKAELRTLAGCVGHVVRRACPNGLTMASHAVGRIEEAWTPTPTPATPGVDDFLSGSSGTVGGTRGTLAALQDRALDLLPAPRAPDLPARRVLVLAVERPDRPNLMAAARAELARSKHAVTLRTTTPGDRGKFENLNALLAQEDLQAFDWLLVLDDDVALPEDFLDRFLALAERDGLQLAQPAHRRHSHAAWPHTRRRRNAAGARSTTFVEIGPVTAFHRDLFGLLLPFPDLRMGWGLDAHWSALAAAEGFKLGIVDATPVGHTLHPVGAGYAREPALAEARAFLADRPYVRRHEVR